MQNQKILIIGGTQMVGRDFVEFILEKNINTDITILNRGLTNPNLFKEIKHIKYDRNNNKDTSLKGMQFDTIIDFSCYNINQLLNITNHVKYKNYIVLSTLCVNDQNALGDTNHWLHNYCLDKKNLEDYIINNNLNNFLIVRPCVLYGKHDYTGRFYEKNQEIYWTFNNQKVQQDKYHIPVRLFSFYLYSYLSNYYDKKIKSLNINNEGYEELC